MRGSPSLQRYTIFTWHEKFRDRLSVSAVHAPTDERRFPRKQGNSRCGRGERAENEKSAQSALPILKPSLLNARIFLY